MSQEHRALSDHYTKILVRSAIVAGTAIFLILPVQVSAQTFADVSENHWAYIFIEALAATGVTSGCGGGDYCPDHAVTRAQMAVFLERGMRGSSYSPPAATGTVFLDVGAGDFAASFIEQLFDDGITSGCGGGNYCPDVTVTRDQMAVFLLRARYGASYSPPAPSGVFGDVAVNHWAGGWIEQLATEGITAGCGGGNYCPDAPVTRDQMAVFLVRTFDIDVTSIAEILAKYDLREQKNAHWSNTVNANPGQSVIDQMFAIDLDDDGDDDLVVPQIMNPRGDPNLYQELEMAVFRDTGADFVQESTNIAVNMSDVAIGDFNGDGLEDAFVANAGFDDEPFAGGQSRLLLQNNDGTLSDLTLTNVPTALLFTHAVCSGDFDNDSDVDLFLAVVNMEHLAYENDGTGVFVDATADILPPEMQSTPNPEASFQWCEVADFDLDGRDDLVLGQQHIGRPEQFTRDANGNVLLDSLVVLYGSDTGALVTDYARGLLPVTWDLDDDRPQVVDIKAEDFDLDNCLDIVVSSVTGGSIGQVLLDPASNFAIHFGDCAGGFSDPTNYTLRPITDSANTLSLADFNDDGFPDFVNRYIFDPLIDGGLEVPPVADDDYDSLAFINNQSTAEPFLPRELTRSDVEQLDIVSFLGLIHGSLP